MPKVRMPQSKVFDLKDRDGDYVPCLLTNHEYGEVIPAKITEEAAREIVQHLTQEFNL